MVVFGMVDPGRFSIEEIPGTNRSLIKLYTGVKAVRQDEVDGYQYNEYHVEVETWDGIFQNVRDNYQVFLQQGMRNDPEYLRSIIKKSFVAEINSI